jgi:hypothetical protein
VDFALYESFTGELRIAQRDDSFEVTLPRMGCRLQYVVPIRNGFAAFGLVNKYNAPATIISEKYLADKIELSLYEGGVFKAYSKERPSSLLINGKEQPFTYKDQIISAEINGSLKKPVLMISW